MSVGRYSVIDNYLQTLNYFTVLVVVIYKTISVKSKSKNEDDRDKTLLIASDYTLERNKNNRMSIELEKKLQKRLEDSQKTKENQSVSF